MMGSHNFKDDFLQAGTKGMGGRSTRRVRVGLQLWLARKWAFNALWSIWKCKSLHLCSRLCSLFFLAFFYVDYFEEMKEYGPIYTLWSASEEELVDPLRGVANCIDKSCKITEALNTKLSCDLIPIIHEYVLYSETLSVSIALLCTFHVAQGITLNQWQWH